LVQRLELKNGFKLLVEKRPSKSVSLLLLVNFGSNNEDKKENGIAHFIEHLVFNGPKGLSKKELSARIEGVGGELNGATSNNLTVYYIQVLSKHFDIALKTLNDMLFRPDFTTKDVNFEKNIILSEIGHSKDTPHSYAFDLLQEELFPNHPYGKTVLGLKSSVKGIDVKDIKRYYHHFYAPNNMMLAAVGNLTEKQLNAIKKTFGAPKKRPVKKERHSIPANQHRLKVVSRDFKQAHLALALKVMPSTDKDVYAMHVISAILGGGLSSRLMQEIREKRGLAYVVQANFDPMKEYGFFGVYVGTQEKKVEKVKKLIFKEFSKLKKKKISAKELMQAKQLLEGRAFLKIEDSLEAGKNLLTLELYGEKDAQSFMKKVFDVSAADIKRVAKKYLNERDYCLVLLKPEEEVAEAKTIKEGKQIE
jgi:predicted Zn-dependent peptidase